MEKLNYSCVNCSLNLNLEEKDQYTCPNCGSVMLQEKEIKKIKKRLEEDDIKNNLGNYKDKIDQKKINKLLKKEKKIKKKADDKALESVKKYVFAFYELLKDPKAQWQNKVIAAAAILYLFSPIDAIPDFIPVAGLIDDAAVIGMAAKKIYDALSIYINNDPINNSVVDKTLFYNIQPDNNQIKYEYSENNRIRVLNLHKTDLDKYNLNVINNNLVKAPELYIAHPYFYKTLVPFKNYDKFIVDDILREEIGVLSAFGAKNINMNIYDFEHLTNKVNLDAQVYNKIISGEINSKKEKIKYSKKSKKLSFNPINNYDIDFIDNMFWYFTYDNNLNDLIRKIIKGNLSKYQLEIEKSTKEFLSVEARAKAIKKVGAGLNFESSNIIHRKIELEVEFHPKPTGVKSPDILFEKVKERLDKRKRFLNDNYKKLKFGV